jgi:hypothetical protein
MNDPQKNAPAEKESGKKKARVLVDVTINGEAYKPDDVVTVDAQVLASHRAALDSDPAAVKYAESLKRKAAAED